MKSQIILCLLTLLLPLSGAALPVHAPVPGGIYLLGLGEIGDRPEVRYAGKPVMTIRDDSGWVAVIGIPLSARPGSHEVEIGPTTVEFPVVDKAYAEQHLTIPDRRMVHPDPEDLERIAGERPRIVAAMQAWSDTRPGSMAFTPPVDGRRSSQFGLRRVLNGEPRNPHAGIDIAAPIGTPIWAPAPGTVIEADHFFFNGKTVFLDHGQGLVTMYCHMDEIGVEPGQRVEAGESLGTVGATGRVTAAHLHFSVALNGVWVDPDLFMSR